MLKFSCDTTVVSSCPTTPPSLSVSVSAAASWAWGCSLSTKLKTVLAMRHSTPGPWLLRRARFSRPSLLLQY